MRGLIVVGFAFGCLVASGCGDANNPATPTPTPVAPPAKGPEGRLIADGSSTVYPITHEAKSSYGRVNSNTQVLVSIHGTTGGFARYLSSEVDIVNASRPATADEESKARENDLAWTPFVVGYDGVTVVVNTTNTFVKDLSVEQLKRLFEPQSTVHTWNDLDPAWPDRAIHLYVPDTESGTFDFFTEAIVGKVDSQREDVKTSVDDGTLVKDVAGDPDGLGYFGFSYYSANKADIRAVPIRPQSNAPAVMPDLDTLLRRQYTPLGRPLFIYVKKAAMARPEVSAFVRHYLKNVEELATLAGYVPPSAEDVAANGRALQEFAPTSTR